MSEKRIRMVVGLGNPGPEYADTRHNAGFLVVDRFAERFSISLGRKKFDTVYGRGTIDGIDLFLAKPTAFMNRSGTPVKRTADYFNVSIKDMVVVHDDIDLVFGRLKIKRKGGDGGHKGIRSIIEAFGGGEFTRLRIGVGRSGGHKSVTDHVLGQFRGNEKQILNKIVDRACDAVFTILTKGAAEGMNAFNDRRLTVDSE
jgi:PTH1 family peptidyl-tRNA hydrolase